MCQWVKHINGVNIDNYELTLVDLKNVLVINMINGCLPTMSHMFSMNVNQFEEMPLFTNPMNIKRIEKDFNKNLMLYM
jgi:hypothetical protein